MKLFELIGKAFLSIYAMVVGLFERKQLSLPAKPIEISNVSQYQQQSLVPRELTTMADQIRNQRYTNEQFLEMQASQNNQSISLKELGKQQNFQVKEELILQEDYRFKQDTKNKEPLTIHTASQAKQLVEKARLEKIQSKLNGCLKLVMDRIECEAMNGNSQLNLSFLVKDNILITEVIKVLKEKEYQVLQNSMTLEWFVRWS